MSQYLPDNLSSASSDTQQIRVVIFQEDNLWIGQCVEYDICVQGATLSDLSSRLVSTVSYECEHGIARHGTPFAGIPPAPARFEEMWNSRSGDFMPAAYIASQHKIGLEMGLRA
jgi:hypothetical protein